MIIDRWMLALWRQADGSDLESLLVASRQAAQEPLLRRAALACLAEAGLLERDTKNGAARDLSAHEGPLVSVIIVSHNSRDWLAGCLASIQEQTYKPLEVIVVDNASQDGCADWLNAAYPNQVLTLPLERQRPLAYALNCGVQAASGAYYLLLNPDVVLEPDAVAELVSTATAKPKPAAIAAKLKFLWAPAFLNGLGNSVGAFGWGSDNALGHLDLGQFDGWDELPSACFAAALIPAQAWEVIGPLDEGFPLYYEDSEWCYRARLFDFTINAAPKAVVYHAFSGRSPGAPAGDMTAEKTRQVAYGRLRFTSKILEARIRRRFMRNYALEDSLRAILALLRGRGDLLRAFLQARGDQRHSMATLKEERAAIQSRRVISDQQLLGLQRNAPAALIWRGLPQLTKDIIRHEYLPLMLSGRTRVLPELAGISTAPRMETGFWVRARSILQEEGLGMLLHRLGKILLWRISRP